MSDPNDTKSVFEIVAREPHAWLMEARQLKRAADLVCQELTKIFSVSPHGRPRYEDAAFCKSYMLLSGLALENLVKGVLVGRNPSVVTSEAFNLKGHNLQDLARTAVPTLSRNELDILERLTAFVMWAGRYPIHLRAAENVHPSFVLTDPDLIDHLFTMFVALIEAERPISTVGFVPE